MYKFSEDSRETNPELMDRKFSLYQLKEVYRDLVASGNYADFDAWLYDMLKSQLIMEA